MKIFDIVYEELKKACNPVDPSRENSTKIIIETYFTTIATNVENIICRELCKNKFF